MANINKNEPSTAPQPDRWYNLTLGSSFKDHHPSSKFCTLRYEFKPASIDKNQPGTLQKNKDNRITVEFHNNQPGKPKVSFEGSSEDYKDNDAVLFFDGESFRLERLHRAVKRLRHVRLPGESACAAAAAAGSWSASGGPAAAEAGSPPLAKGNKVLPSNKTTIPAVPVEVERIEIGEVKNSGADAKLRNEKVVDPPIQENESNASPDKMDDLVEQLDILNDDDDDDDDDGVANGGNNDVKEYHSGIDVHIPHQNDTDDEIADVDASDGEADKGRNAAEALRAQVNADEREEQTSSSSGSSGSESSRSGSGTESGSGSSSSDSESSDDDSVNSI